MEILDALSSSAREVSEFNNHKYKNLFFEPESSKFYRRQSDGKYRYLRSNVFKDLEGKATKINIQKLMSSPPEEPPEKVDEKVEEKVEKQESNNENSDLFDFLDNYEG